jgi:hypothetical protein
MLVNILARIGLRFLSVSLVFCLAFVPLTTRFYVRFLKVLLHPIEALHQHFESLQSAAEPRQGAFRRSYYYTLFIIYLIRC